MREFLDKAAKAYYEGSPIISDSEFDALADFWNYKQVGNPESRGMQHEYRMYSLDKVYEGESEVPFPKSTCVETPKLDGTAVALVYKNGYLVRALTRGDGIRSEKDVTEKFLAWKEVPNHIPVPSRFPDIVQVSGEVCAPSTIENARNYAAGALGLKSAEEFASRELFFFAYGLQPYELSDTYGLELNGLSHMGFRTVLDKTDYIPKDGRVFRLNSTNEFLDAGFTNHHPRGAFALKTRQVGVISTLNGVVWQVGKSGKVSPVALLEPVEIGGASVSRATLHNIKYIQDLDLEIGCKVEVIRSGEIIPRVVRRVDA